MLGRLRQVWYYLTPCFTGEDAAWVAASLNPAQLALFEGLSRQDQAHAVRVARRLAAEGAPPYVLEAALLHDCGKPLGYNLFWRSAGVLLSPWLGSLAPEPPLAGWRRWLQVYRWHDEYGLDMAASAATSPEALALLRAYVADQSREAPAWLEPLKRCDDLG